MADDYSTDSADNSSGGGLDFNSLLNTALGSAPGVLQALTQKPATNAPAVSGTPASVAQTQAAASSWTKFIPWAIGALLLFGAVLLFRRKG